MATGQHAVRPALRGLLRSALLSASAEDRFLEITRHEVNPRKRSKWAPIGIGREVCLFELRQDQPVAFCGTGARGNDVHGGGARSTLEISSMRSKMRWSLKAWRVAWWSSRPRLNTRKWSRITFATGAGTIGRYREAFETMRRLRGSQSQKSHNSQDDRNVTPSFAGAVMITCFRSGFEMGSVPGPRR